MCAKFNRTLAGIVPPGPLKEGLKSSYYRFYYNAKHFKENNFRVYYTGGHYEFAFENGITFAAHENLADELKRSLAGYLAHHAIKEGETIIDCGAYVGEFTLYAAKAAGSAGLVIAFEPDAAIYRQLEANVRLNNFTNVVLVNRGVWSKDAVLEFVGDRRKGYSFFLAQEGQPCVRVPVTSLDNELAARVIRRVDFIKMDIEGAELEALKGAEKTIAAYRPGIAIASYHVIDGEKTCAALEKALTRLGYSARTANPGHLTTYGFPRTNPA